MRRLSLSLLSAILFAGLHAQVSVTGMTGSYTQDFNGLINTGTATWTDNSSITDWYSQRSGSGTTIIATDGSNMGGNLYSFGPTSDPDRALGCVGSGNATAGDFAHGVLLQNNTGQVLDSLTIRYVGEQWRCGGNVNAHTLGFYYQVSNAPVTALDPDNNGAWTAAAALNFTSPVPNGPQGALDGNLQANKDTITAALNGLNMAPGEYIMLKWDDPDHSGSDHGLSIDDVEISWNLGGGGGSDLVISEINYQSPVPSPPDTWEYVEITNMGVAPIDLSGYTVSGDIQYTFLNGTMINPGEYLLLAKDSVTLALSGVTAFQWTSGDLSNTLGTVVIKDGSNIVQDSVEFSDSGVWPGGNSNGLGSAIELCNLGGDNNDGAEWISSLIYFDEVYVPGAVSVLGTPGSANICSIYSGPAPQLVINEIFYSDLGVADTLEFVEIYNWGVNAINLEGFYINTGIKYTFPAINLAGGGYAVISSDSAQVSNYLGVSSWQWRTGTLADTQDTLKLFMPDGTLLDSVLYTSSSPWPVTADTASIELCRADVNNADGNNWSGATTLAGAYGGQSVYATPGSGSTCNLFVPITDLVITEINYNNPGADSLEFVEILNNGNDTIDLFGVVLSGDVNYAFGADSLLPGEFLIVSQDSTTMQNIFATASYTWSSGTLSDVSGTVQLHDGLGNLVDSVTYNNTYPWPQAANGGPFSLVLCNHNINNNAGANWTYAETGQWIGQTNSWYWAHPGDSCSSATTADLVITEIMYDDPSTVDSLAFFEVYNNGNQPVDLFKYETFGASFVFPQVTLQPNTYALVAADAAAFQAFYGVTAYQYTGSLQGSQQALVLADSNGNVVDYVNLYNAAPWNTQAAGGGYSLVLCDPTQDNYDFTNWSAAGVEDSIATVNGLMVYAHPDTTCQTLTFATLVITEIMYNSPEASPDIYEFVEVYNPGNVALDITNYELEFGTQLNYTVPSGTVPAQGFAIFAKDSASFVNDYSNLPVSTLVLDWGNVELNNNTTTIRIKDDNGNVIDTVRYSDQAPWPVNSGVLGPDGNGASIVLCDMNLTNDVAANWSTAQSEVPGFIEAARQVFANPGDTCSVTTTPSDQTAPQATGAVTQPCNIIKVTFDEVVTIATAENLTNYVITPGAFTVTNAALNVAQTEVTLTLSAAFPNNTPFNLAVSGVEDLAGNTIASTNLSVGCNFTGIEEEEPVFVNIFPNPADAFIQVEVNKEFENILVHDLTGKQVYSAQFTGNGMKLDVSALSPGIYMVTLKGEANTIVRKIVIE